MIGKSLLRQPGEPLVCYCPPGVCQAPRGFRGPCRRASDVQTEGEAEYASWQARAALAVPAASTEPVYATPPSPHPSGELVEAAMRKGLEALEMAQSGLQWYRVAHPEEVDGSDDEADAGIESALAALRSALERLP